MTDVPFIRSGTGSTPAEGGCWMQVIDWTAHDGSWTDAPDCVHPVIRSLGIAINDRLPDDKRQVLLEPRFTYRAMGTNTGDEILTRKLLGYLARQVYPIYAEWKKSAGYEDNGSVLDCIQAAERGEA
ncbi:MAG: hypothetical protein H0U55_14585, partial [Rubrobacteraceae bacterium]|nr:hypothetical protein [Rubrobacteraceae bacterium]